MRKKPDYLTQIVSRKREGFLIEPDGSKLIVPDGLAVKFFEILGFRWKSSNYRKIIFSSEENEVFMVAHDYDLQIQFKSGFFLLSDWEERLIRLYKYQRENAIGTHHTRLDWTYTSSLDLFPLIRKTDFKKLLIKTYEKENRLENITASNRNIDIVFYDKTQQMKSLKKSKFRQKYVERYEQFFPEPQSYNFELRLKNKVILDQLTSLRECPIDFELLEEEVWKAVLKRAKFPKKMIKIINEWRATIRN